MSLVKKLAGDDRVRPVLCGLAAGYMRLVYRTTRWTRVGFHIPKHYLEQGKPVILCFWHGRLLMMPYAWDHRYAWHMLISSHRDGQLIANTVRRFGIQSVTGSKTRGGASALRSLLKTLKQGRSVGVTPDGPAGPRMRASEGIIAVARLSGAPILPATYAVSRRRVLATWDRFIVPRPFARGVLAWGEPIHVARDADEEAQEAARQRVEDALNALTDEADRMCGCPPIEPAPVAVPEAAS